MIIHKSFQDTWGEYAVSLVVFATVVAFIVTAVAYQVWWLNFIFGVISFTILRRHGNAIRENFYDKIMARLPDSACCSLMSLVEDDIVAPPIIVLHVKARETAEETHKAVEIAIHIAISLKAEYNIEGGIVCQVDHK